MAHSLPVTLEGADLRLTGVVAAMPRLQEQGVRFRVAVEAVQILDGPMTVNVAANMPHMVDLGWYASTRQPSLRVDSGPLGDNLNPNPNPDPGPSLNPPPTPDAQEWDAGAALAALPMPMVGQRWEWTVRLRQPHGALNPHTFDYERWMWEEGVQATGYVRTSALAQPPKLLGAVWLPARPGLWVERMRQRVRDAIMQRLAAGGHEPAASPASHASGVIAALVTGEQRMIERDVWRVFRATGVSHLMAISGIHITMFAWVAAGIVGWLWRRSARLMLWRPAPQAALAGGVALAVGYAIFSGWGIPAQRTCLMLLAWAVLRSVGVRWPWHATLLMAAACVALWQPLALLSAGFWLSFGAVGVLLGMVDGAASRSFAQPSKEDVKQTADVGAGEKRQPLQRLARGLAAGVRRLYQSAVALLRLQWRMTLALAPLTVLFFGQLSVVGLLANLVAIPWVSLLVAPLAMLGVMLPVAWDGAAALMEMLMYGLHWLASWPAAELFLPVPPWPLAALVALGCLLVIAPLPRSLRMSGAALALLLWVWQADRPLQGHFQLLALDVGQGSAVVVQTRRHTLVYDAGPRYSSANNAGSSVIVPSLRALGRVPDMLLISHADADHAGGAADVLDAFAHAAHMASFAWAKAQQEQSASQHITEYAARPVAGGQLAGGQLPDGSLCQAGMRWQWDEVTFEILHPPVQAYAQQTSSPAPARNAMSCVLRISASNGIAALLTGDIGRLQELDLTLRTPEALRAHYLLVPHHGSAGSSSSRFLQAVQPQVAVVQAGYRNLFGHPAPQALQRLQATGATVVATPSCGAAQWQSTQPSALTCQRQVRKRFWHVGG